MRLSEHMALQDDAVYAAINAAAEAGADRDEMDNLYNMLTMVLETLELAGAPISTIAVGYFTAFADAGTEWDYNIKRAKGILASFSAMLGDSGGHLKDRLEDFDEMRRSNPEGARIFGFGLTRLHPYTVGLEESLAETARADAAT